MRTNDARRLDHATLEAMRERAVRSVQEGESPEVVARVIGVSRSTMYGWLHSMDVVDGGLESHAAVWTPTETRWQEGKVDLRYGDTKEPIAAQVFVCIVDARDGSEADRRQI